MSKTVSNSFGTHSGREDSVVVRVRFLMRERRVRLAPLLLTVLANELERVAPGNMTDEESGMRHPAEVQLHGFPGPTTASEA